MRKFIVKYFALDYICKVFGYTFNFTRSASFIFPLFVFNALLVMKFDYQIWQILTALPLAISLFIGFIYFRFAPVKWQELDNEQLFQYRIAIEKNLIVPDNTTHYMILAFNKASIYVNEHIEQRSFYKPLRLVFQPLIMVAISIITTLIVI